MSCRGTNSITGSEQKPDSMYTTHVAERDSTSEEDVFRVQKDLSNDESVPELLSAEPLDNKVEDGDGEDWFLVMNENIFDRVWDFEES